MYIWRSFLSGIKLVWKIINILREIFLNVVFLFIFLIIIGIFGLISGTQDTTMQPQYGVLLLDLEGIIVDTTKYDNDLYQITKKLGGKKVDLSRENNLFELVHKIDQAKDDPEIKGMVLKLNNFVNADLPSLNYIGKYLNKFKEQGKSIYAISDSYNQKQYYLASYANEIYLTHQGNVSVFGLSANNFYFKSLLDNLKIDAHVFRVGTYKSAVEPYIRDDMSQEAKMNASRWLNLMWKNYLSNISQLRNKDAETLVPETKTMLAQLRSVGGSMSQYAHKQMLVDHVVQQFEFDQIIKYKFGGWPLLSIYDYNLDPTRMQAFTNNENKTEKPLIAVVFVDGTIADGENTNTIAGSDSIVEYLEKIKNNYNVKALVVRINSPGGSVYASEEIRSQLEAIQQIRKIPIIVSMGGLTASGGYWISSASDAIVADRNTLTGSIGIFGIIPTFERSLAHIGIHSDGVATSSLAGLNIASDLPEEAKELMQLNIENGYSTFLQLVSAARNLSYDEVDKIAQGQIWLGEEALEIGLVDKLGDFDDAVTLAAQKAHLTQYDIDWQKPQSSWFDAFVSQYAALMPNSALEVLYNQLPVSRQLKQQLSLWDNLNDPQNRYIYCLNCAEVN